MNVLLKANDTFIFTENVSSEGLLIKCVFLWSDTRWIQSKFMSGYSSRLYMAVNKVLVKITQSTHFPRSFSQEGFMN